MPRVSIIVAAALGAALTWGAASPAAAQSLDEQLDGERFLQGLAEYGLEDLLDYALEQAGEDDPAMAMLVEVAHRRAAVARAPAGSVERGAAIDELLDARRAIINQHPRDTRRPVWQTDLAFDLVFLAPTENALDLIVEFGVASEDQRHRLHDWASEAADLADEAIAGLADVVLDLEEDPDYGTDAMLQQRHRRLVQVEQRQRLPWVLAAAEYLRAVAAPPAGEESGAEDGRVWSRVAETLTPLALELPEPWRSRARALGATALARTGESVDALDRLDAVLASGDADPVALIRARFGRVEALAGGGGDPVYATQRALDELATDPTVRRDPFLYLLLCDQRFRLEAGSAWPEGGRTDETPDPQQVLLACEVYNDYVANDELPLTRPQRERVVADRWALVVPPDVPFDELPPGMALAQARRLAGEAATRDEGLKRLEAVLARGASSPQTAPTVLYAIAEALVTAGREVEAIEPLLRLAAEFPEDARAPVAVEAAAAMAQEQYRANPADENAAARYDRALGLLVERFPTRPSIDRWSFERGLFESQRGRWEAALAALRAVAPTADVHADARFQIAAALSQAAALPTGASAEEKEESQRRIVEAADEAIKTARSALQASPGLSGARRAELVFYIDAADALAADALLALGQPDAALERLARFTDLTAVPDRIVAEVVDLRVRAAQAQGDGGGGASSGGSDAQTDLAALAQRDPDRALALINRIAAARYAELLQMEASEQASVESVVAAARDRMMPIAALGWSIGEPRLASGGDEPFLAGLHLAEGRRLAGDFDKARPLFDLLAEQRPNAAEVVFGQAETRFQTGEYAEALPLFQRVASGLSATSRDGVADDGAATRPSDDGLSDTGSSSPSSALVERYWLAELRSLQILDLVRRNTDRIYPRIQRLRLLDDTFGGERLAREFLALDNKYAR